MNQFLKVLRHELNYGTTKQYQDAFSICMLSVACWEKGRMIKGLVHAAEESGYREEICLPALIQAILDEKERDRLFDLLEHISDDEEEELRIGLKINKKEEKPTT